MVHCGSVRQAVRVLSVQELPLPAASAQGGSCTVDGCNLASAITAAAALLGASPETAHAYAGHVGNPSHDATPDPAPYLAGASQRSAPLSKAVHIPGAPEPTSQPYPDPSSGPAGQPWAAGAGEPVAAEGAGDLGCTARVVFEFCHRPEWLQAGARLIVRDSADGCTAGAGVIKSLTWP